MPISKSPLEYYRYYCASQRRVEQWVQDTERLLQNPPAQSETQWRGFLEDPGLATPISPLLPLEPKRESENRHLAGVPEHDSQACRGIERLDQAHDLDPTVQRGRPFTTTTKGSHEDSTLSQRSQQPRSDDKPVSDHVPAVPTSSKHSKDSKQSRHTSKSKNSGSSSSRKRRHPRKEVDRSIVTYIPYGIIPLLFAMTTGSSAISLAAASITLAGYLCLDYTNTAEKRHSRE